MPTNTKTCQTNTALFVLLGLRLLYTGMTFGSPLKVTFAQTFSAITLFDVNEDIFSAIIGCDEAEALVIHELLHDTDVHTIRETRTRITL